MEFLTKEQCREFMKRAGLDADLAMDTRRIPSIKNAARFYYDGIPGGLHAGKALADWYPKYNSAVFWASGSPWGDGWGEFDHLNMAHRPKWQELVALRAARGEPRRIYDMPGHLLAPEERALIVTLVEAAVATGWDCVLAARPHHAVMYCSHDDCFEIQSDKNLTSIAEKLEKLGLRRGEFR
jgi:hypothetical protein